MLLHIVTLVVPRMFVPRLILLLADAEMHHTAPPGYVCVYGCEGDKQPQVIPALCHFQGCMRICVGKCLFSTLLCGVSGGDGLCTNLLSHAAGSLCVCVHVQHQC